MKSTFKLFSLMTLFVFAVVTANAQVETTVTVDKELKKECDPKNCDPALCDAMVKAGICTKEEAEACKAKCAKKTTKVASASVERSSVSPVGSAKVDKKTSFLKTCAKICTSKKKVKEE